jgi:hypothetical protein
LRAWKAPNVQRHAAELQALSGRFCAEVAGEFGRPRSEKAVDLELHRLYQRRADLVAGVVQGSALNKPAVAISAFFIPRSALRLPRIPDTVPATRGGRSRSWGNARA